ncbi:MAG: ADP-forming succinate--CoA ligase subunit beta [Dehalococcoidales bacterium]|nr:ADP-forming succinate--CoA ligase subunit beta [Dehalococcoidales bacterium]
MKLFEFEAKKILEENGIAVPWGRIAHSAAEAEAIAREMGSPAVLKAQVLVAGRGKSGGILFASDAAEAGKTAARLLGSTIKGNTVSSLLVEEKLDISGQFYASVAIDRQARRYVILASSEGGIDIEETALASPDKIARSWADPATGFNQAASVEMLGNFRLGENDTVRFAAVLDRLYTVAMDYDAELVEVNPLARTAAGEFIAADARIIIDDNALFRHPELKGLISAGAEDTPLEAEARKQNLAYVDLDGDIGIVGNGAGLMMATLDLVHYFGGRPANFLDIGGGGNVGTTKNGLLMVMSKPAVKAVLVNILGGITRCDVVARAIIAALNESRDKKPVVVRMMGTNETEGNRMLHQAGIATYPDVEEAIEEVLKL